MAKSKETFNKKEKEKLKQKKRQDKQQKKEDRQANARDGKNINDMMAYVDENGNLVSTPPDPKKRVEINVEDIELGARKHEPEEEGEKIRNGVVTKFNDQKGYGFIKDTQTQESVFVHINALHDRIQEHDKVTFEVENTFKGKNAVNVKKA